MNYIKQVTKLKLATEITEDTEFFYFFSVLSVISVAKKFKEVNDERSGHPNPHL
jgi:hypothetical protein